MTAMSQAPRFVVYLVHKWGHEKACPEVWKGRKGNFYHKIPVEAGTSPLAHATAYSNQCLQGCRCWRSPWTVLADVTDSGTAVEWLLWWAACAEQHKTRPTSSIWPTASHPPKPDWCLFRFQPARKQKNGVLSGFRKHSALTAKRGGIYFHWAGLPDGLYFFLHSFRQSHSFSLSS